METVDKDYLKGFNQGYLLAKHEPTLLKTLLKGKLPENEYFKGINAGKDEYNIEKMKSRLKTPTKSEPSKAIIKGKGK